MRESVGETSFASFHLHLSIFFSAEGDKKILFFSLSRTERKSEDKATELAASGVRTCSTTSQTIFP